MKSKRLTAQAVHEIRTAGLTDAYMARKYRRTPHNIRLARTGVSHADHPTPPDLRLRGSGGRYSTQKAALE